MTDVNTLVRRWWQGELGAAGVALSVGLAPAEALYRGAIAARNAAFDVGVRRVQRAGIPVISVGNVAVGGTGKTPVAQFIARRLHERGARPAILHGGYADDEPALHRLWSPDIPVFVGGDRVHAAQQARAQGATVLVLDDGFQHRRLHRDLDVVLVAAERWQSTTRLLPRGPWREPRAALARAGMIMVTRKTATATDAQRVQQEIRNLTTSAVVLAQLASNRWLHRDRTAAAPERAALAVAAVAEPELFAVNAQSAGAALRDVMWFADHHAYTPADARDIVRAAADAPIITTEKDWVKLRALLPHDQVWRLAQSVIIEHGVDSFHEQLEHILRLTKSSNPTRA